MDRTITLENVRTASDVTMPTRLKDGGVAIDWTTLTDIKAWHYSDAQRAMAGRCTLRLDESAPDVLVCEYSALKPQYPGVNRLIVQAKYMGRVKTYDKPVLNFVPRTAQVAGEQIVLVDPIVNVEIEVEDVTSSILDSILAACVKATEEAREIVDASRGPRGFSAYEVACQNGFEGTEEEWLLSLQGKSAYEIAVELGYEGTEEQWIASLNGENGKSAYQIAVEHGFVGTEEQWLASLVGPAGKSAYQLAVDQGYEGTLAEWLASLKGPAGDSAYQVAVEEGFVGTKAQWLASLVGPQGLSAYQVAVVNGYEGTVGEWLASLVGPAGPPGVTSCVVTVDNTSGDSPGGEASVENSVLTLRLFGIRGLPGVGIDDVATPVVVDGTFNILLTNGNVVTIDLNHQHAAYYSKVADTAQPSGGFLPDVIYKLGTLTGSVTFALAAAVSGNANHYFIVFETGGTAPTITWPSGLTWAAGSAPTLAANKHYEVSIMDGVAAYLEV